MTTTTKKQKNFVFLKNRIKNFNVNKMIIERLNAKQKLTQKITSNDKIMYLFKKRIQKKITIFYHRVNKSSIKRQYDRTKIINKKNTKTKKIEKL